LEIGDIDMDFLKKYPKDMSDAELREAHRLMWGYIARNSCFRKHAYFEFMHISECKIPHAGCYACQRVKNLLKRLNMKICSSFCEYCPCNWGIQPMFWTDNFWCMSKESTFDMWDANPDKMQRRKFAEQIRDSWPENII
jgi:hypothetical protein